MGGYETKKINVECSINGWYFGNIVFGGLIGFLIVDPVTGAMFKLDHPGIYETLHASTHTTSTSPSLNILDKNHLPEGWEKHLVRIN
jgi:hypothetical protein